jgi:N-acylneuraminate cytidylyltransferase
MKSIAIIPARGGSKRIPRKNIKPFCGKPIIAYSIEAAIASNLFDEVMVSTDDEEIATIAKQYGAKVPFMRSEVNADDYAGTGDVVFEVLEAYKQNGISFELACCIYATAPFIQIDKITEAHQLLIHSSFDVVFPLAKYSSPIWRSYSMDTQSSVKMFFPENEAKRSQDLPEAFYDTGQFYFLKTENMHLLPNKNSFGFNKGAITIEEYAVQDIDNQSDWDMAEIKYEYLKLNLFKK